MNPVAIVAGCGPKGLYCRNFMQGGSLFISSPIFFSINSKFPATVQLSPIGENHHFFINFPIKFKTFQSTALNLHANCRSSLISYDSHFITSLIIFLAYRSCFLDLLTFLPSDPVFLNLLFVMEDYERRMHPECQDAVRVYGLNCVSVVRISSGHPLALKGTGIIWDNMGHIVTNFHVIENASDFRVTIFDGTTYDAKDVRFCKNKDVAVLHAKELEGKLKPISIGFFANLHVGQPVFAIGNPFGLDRTLTSGVISSLDRVITSPNGRPIRDIIQIDAVLNPGNSGGPLFDRFGKLIGINTAIETRFGGFCGIGYSIPIHSVRGIIDQLVSDGKVLHPHLGITLSSVQFVDESDWLLVVDVAVDGPAAKAGLQKTDPYASILGDLITSVNGKKVTNSEDLLLILDLCKEGEKVTVEVLRDGRKKDLSVTLELNPDESESDVMPTTGKKFKC